MLHGCVVCCYVCLFFSQLGTTILLSFLICCFEFNTASYSEVKMKGVQDMLFFFSFKEIELSAIEDKVIIHDPDYVLLSIKAH